MSWRPKPAATILRALDLGLPALLLAAALFSHSLSLVCLAALGLIAASRDLLSDGLARRSGGKSAEAFQFGLSKVLQSGNLLIGLTAALAGFWLAEKALLRLTDFGGSYPFRLAIAATTNALLVIWSGFSAYAPFRAPGRVSRETLGARRKLFALSLLAQVLLTLEVVSLDPGLMFWGDTLAAVVLSLVIVVSGLKLSWECIRDLIDHPLDRHREAELLNLLHRVGVPPGDVADLRTRRCGQQIFAELTLNTAESQQMEEIHRRLTSLWRSLEQELANLDLVIKLQGARPSQSAIGTGSNQRRALQEP